MSAVRSIFGGAVAEAEPAADAASFAPRFRAENPPQTAISQREDNGIRYQRGSLIYATDGPVGTLRQVVIDEEMAEVKALVVRMAAKNESVLMPPDLVDKSVGSDLMLNVTKEQFILGARRSPRLEPRMFAGADPKNVARVVPLVFAGDARRSVVSLSGDCVETSDVLEPPAQTAPARSGWRKLVRWR